MFWKDIQVLSRKIYELWVVERDFNPIIHINDKKGGKKVTVTDGKGLLGLAIDCQMVDISYVMECIN